MRYTNDQLKMMAKPASDSEEERLENATRIVKDTLYATNVIPNDDYVVFAQGSYANNTNVRNNSDVDINICYTGAFFYDIPVGTTKEQYGLTNPSTYSFKNFKDDVEKILVQKFGRDQVVRKNKCIHIKGNTYRTEIDVVPTMRYRHYVSPNNGNYEQGVKLISDSGDPVINFPEQHLDNGRSRNNNTRERYKKLVRIIKRVHLNMEEDGYYVNSNITSFLLESMVYLIPVSIYRCSSEYYDWNEIIKDAINYWYKATKEEESGWKDWTEVSELLYLMRGHKWNRTDVFGFVYNMWNYLFNN